MDFEGRRGLLQVVVGSHNYNLNTPSSDVDYKIFVAPTFDDLYFGKEFKNSIIGETADYAIHDIRKMTHLFEKANINFLEVLFSNSCDISKDNRTTQILLQEIFNMRDDIAQMNLPYLYNACVGMHYEKRNNVLKGTAGTQHLVDKFGYDTKQALHSLRVLDFLRRFANNQFTDFKDAIWYNTGHPTRDYYFEVKDGKYTLEQYYQHATNLLTVIEEKYKDTYRLMDFNIDTSAKLTLLIKEIVREEVFNA